MTLTLAIAGIDNLIIEPKLSSTRSVVNWVKLGNPTARGVSVIEGVTARSAKFIWNIDCTLYMFDLLKLYRIIAAQQERIAQGLSTGIINLSDTDWEVDAIAATKTGRTIIGNDSTTTLASEIGKFCRFAVFAELPEGNVKSLRRKEYMNSPEEVSLILREL